VQTPAHAALGDLLSYASSAPLVPGTLVRVPLGRREVLGVVWNEPTSLENAEPDMALKPVGAALDALAPLGDAWRDLVAFAARYYQRSIGEIALAALPPQLRDLTTTQLARRLKRKARSPLPRCRRSCAT
jgi:primosomal protein N' (replication factor Y)